MRKTISASLLLLSMAAACRPNEESAHDAGWAYNAVVYEMNVRQYTEEGTFDAAREHLPRLRELGVDIVWLMPIHEIGVKGRKGTLGSYYAIKDYKSVNHEFGTLEDFDEFVAEAHRCGLKLIIDCVANHTSPDCDWVTEKPADWYMRDSLGNTLVEYDWTDIAKLNYDNPDVRDAVRDAMRFWLDRGIDGFRCDMAFIVPQDFWAETIPALRSEYERPLYFLAEGEKPWLHEVGFDASYTWECHHLLNAIAQGKAGAAELKALMEKYAEEFPGEAFRLMFTSNHDENSWSGSEYERMGKAAQLMAVLTFTLPQSQPLIYTAQETGYDHRIQFFEKDPVPCWCECDASRFYRDLCALKHGHSALQSGEKGGRYECVEASWVDEDIFAFTRSNEDETLMIIANFSNDYKKIGMEDASDWTDAVSPVGPCCMTLAPWGWKILVKN